MRSYLMVDTDPVSLDERERDEFLESGNTGVLSLSVPDDAPHSIPVSYGYDSVDEVFYFRLAVGPDTKKGSLDGRPVSFVVYGRHADVWKSVVASGALRETTADDVALQSLEGLERVHIPLVDIFGEPVENVSFEFYRLDPEQITGRVEETIPE